MQGVGVVARPEFVVVRQQPVVDTAAAAGAGLHHQIRVLGMDTLEDVFHAAVVGDVEVRLFVAGQVGRPVVEQRHVGVPLDVGDFGVLRHQLVHDAEHEFLHFGVRQVEHELCASATLVHLAVGLLDHPFGVLLEKLALRVGHLGFDPDAELEPFLPGRGRQPLDALGEFLLADHPVAEARRAVVARVFVAEPAVVHHEHLPAHGGEVGHHLIHHLLVDVHRDAFPAVEQDAALLAAVVEPVQPRPAVEVAADAALALVAEGEGEYGGRKDLFRFEDVLRLVFVDAGEDACGVGIVVVDGDTVVAAPCQRAADDHAVLFVGAPVEREHERRAAVLRIAYAVLVLDDPHAVGQRFLVEVCLGAPGAVEVREPVVAAAHGQEGRRETVERDGFLFQVADLRPGLDHLAVGIGLVVDGDIERVEFVSGRDRRDLAAVAVLPGDRLHDQFERHIAVVVGCLNGCFTRALDAELGVYRVVEGAPAVEYVAGIRQPGAEVLYPGRFTLWGRDQDRAFPVGNNDVISPENPGTQ